MSVTEEPAQLLKNIAICEDNFARAWDILIDRYENKRILIDSHLSVLLSTRSIKQESSSELKRLISEIKENLGALEALDCPTNQWDNILVFLIVRRLDPETLKDWEKSIGSKKSPATFKELESFLFGRIHSLEAIEQLTSTKRNIPIKPIGNVKSHNVSTPTHNQSCSLCHSNHYISSCQQFMNKSPLQRREFVISKNLCFNCLGPHLMKNCRSSKRCRICQRQHHTSLHGSNAQSQTVTSQITSSDNSNNSIPHTTVIQNSSHMAVSHLTTKSTILLATALVNIAAFNGKPCLIRALIDQGSEVSFISESLCQLLQLPRRSKSVPIHGVGGQATNISHGNVDCYLSSRTKPYMQYRLNALVLPQITAYVPPQVICNDLQNELKDITLADPHFMSSTTIDVILGVDIYSQIMKSGIRRLNNGSILLQNTTLGWILSGSIHSENVKDKIYSFQCSPENNLYELMHLFWNQEESQIVKKPLLTKEEQDCEDYFKLTHTRDSKGRFIVRLPFRNTSINIGDSYAMAEKALLRMESRFLKNPNFQSQYSRFMEEYLSLGHMIECSKEISSVDQQFFLPHHGVIKESSTSTKLRVVFNGSQKSTSGMSLNDYLLPGPKLQNDLVDVLMRWRQHPVAFAADIEKMYRQIKVHSDHLPFQQILWRTNPSDPIKIYQLSTVTYGLTCAPYLAIRCLHQLAEEHSKTLPFASDIILNDIYVDDILSGANDTIHAKEKIHQLNGILVAGGFLAKKWSSNSQEIISSLPEEYIATSDSRSFENNLMYRTLGLIWKSNDDSFIFSWKTFSVECNTFIKRSILSVVAQMFNPLG
nr:uncharacterized protein LOC111421154 [Onthophagus taurus]